MDIFTAHRCDLVLQRLSAHHIHQVLVPASCTCELLLLDLSVKDECRTISAGGMQMKALHNSASLDKVKIDLLLNLCMATD